MTRSNPRNLHNRKDLVFRTKKIYQFFFTRNQNEPPVVEDCLTFPPDQNLSHFTAVSMKVKWPIDKVIALD